MAEWKKVEIDDYSGLDGKIGKPTEIMAKGKHDKIIRS